MKKIVVTAILLFASYASYAEVEVHQKNIGNVTAKLEASNLNNVTAVNLAVGNLATINNSTSNAVVNQNNVGDVTSNVNISNLSNQAVHYNAAGTVFVAN